MVSDWRGPFPRPHVFSQERFNQSVIDDGRFSDIHESHRRQPPMEIADALRVHCSIAARKVFVAVIMDDGSPMTFGGPDARLDESLISQFFDLEQYRRVMEHLDATATNITEGRYGLDSTLFRPPMDISRSRTIERRRTSGLGDWDSTTRQTRKRMRPRHPVTDDDDNVPMIMTTVRRGLQIGNTEDVERFYDQRFKNCQQTACKLMAKAWVKAVEPKKQSTHPYTGSDEKAPDWWPKPWGPTKEDKVRHKEPDHLYKRERVHLLIHILRMIVQPREKQLPGIQKLNLSVKKLEEVTIEALSTFFTDKENPANARKKPYLNEIFRVAKQEERFLKGEIDAETTIYVLAEEKFPGSYASETDDGPTPMKENDELEVSSAKSTATHSLMPTPTTDHNPAAPLNGTAYMNDLPVRGSSYPPPMIPALPPAQHGFVEGGDISVTGQTQVHAAPNTSIALDMGVPSPHDGSRRPSTFSPAGDYSGSNGTGLYAQQWQQGSAAPSNPPMYTFNQQPANPPQGSFVSQTVPISQSQPYIPSSFDGLPRSGYDPSQTSIYRPGGVPSQSNVPSAQGYDYMEHDNRGISTIKVDPGARDSMH